MSGTDPNELSEKEQLLLSAYVDSECSLIAKWRAERLLARNSQARDFVFHLKKTSQTYRTYTPVSAEAPVDLWSRISNRIDAEERAALYLGQRKLSVEEARKESFITRYLSRHAVLGGMSGAAVAAMAIVMISRPSNPSAILPVYSGNPVAAHNSSPFHQASLGSPQQAFSARSTMEVDWMRANGSLRLIQNPSGKSAIIWVRKRTNGALKNQGINPTPTTHALLEEGLDVRPLGVSK